MRFLQTSFLSFFVLGFIVFSSQTVWAKTTGLSKLEGVWYYDVEATIKRSPGADEYFRSESILKIVISVSAKTVTVYDQSAPNEKYAEESFTVTSDNGKKVVFADGSVFTFLDNNTMTYYLGDGEFVFTRKEPKKSK